jgi:hypothetical protein
MAQLARLTIIKDKPQFPVEAMTMTKKAETRDYKLISGEFSPEDAQQVLLSLIDFKIRFHQLKNWSQEERTGTTDTSAELRIAELTRTKADLSALIEQMMASDRELSVNCDISIEFTPN